MYQMADASSQWSWIYFVLLVVLVAYFAINLAVAVLFVNFSEARSVRMGPGRQGGA